MVTFVLDAPRVLPVGKYLVRTFTRDPLGNLENVVRNLDLSIHFSCKEQSLATSYG